jgi:DNA-binding GntR family transcriptional regulator
MILPGEARDFDVSRTPVREALRKLQALHLVDVVPNKGATVRVPKRAELSDAYVLRAELEGFAGGAGGAKRRRRRRRRA